MLKRLAESDTDKKEILTIICSYWSDHSQYIELLMDKLVNYKIFTLSDVLSFTFDILKVAPELPWIWHVIPMTFDKLLNLATFSEDAALVIPILQSHGYFEETAKSTLVSSLDQEPVLEWLFHAFLRCPEAISITGFTELAQFNSIAALILNQFKFLTL